MAVKLSKRGGVKPDGEEKLDPQTLKRFPRGVMGNEQSHCMQLPHTFWFSHLAQGGRQAEGGLALGLELRAALNDFGRAVSLNSGVRTPLTVALDDFENWRNPGVRNGILPRLISAIRQYLAA